ncbi:MAG TPA: DUF1223 domain-containing protein [Casimicrobiaceae bacterium]|nr:DUF1223 domain-containing protein [Casimicrobiaceae bacterium]
MRLLLQLVVLFAALTGVEAHAASACHASSGTLTRPLIELYTSEGCDSCPPAERWLSSRFGAAGTASQAIALAFHVDYWDRLGWVDRFANADYTARQYAMMHANGGTFVYTPQLLLQGRDFAAWRDADTSPIDAAARTNAAATIVVDVVPGERELVVHADARIVHDSGAHDAELFVAYADSGLVSQIGAGENRGLRLTHDHVVRTLRLAGRDSGAGHVDATLTLTRPIERGARPMLVAFVERASTGDVLQALALPLDACTR